MNNSLSSFSLKATSPFLPIPFRAKEMTKVPGGQFVFILDPWKSFERFLILGTEGGTFSFGEKVLTAENAKNVIACIEKDGERAVRMIKEVSNAGRAPSNDPAIFALALAAAAPEEGTRRLALEGLGGVCRISTHLFHFLTYLKNFRGFGPAVRRAVAAWYLDRPLDDLAFQVVKYRQRDGISHRDVLRLIHPKTSEKERDGIFRWILKAPLNERMVVGKTKEAPVRVYKSLEDINLPSILNAFDDAQDSDLKDLPLLITKFNLPREALPTEALKRKDVWEALLERMPPGALLRNLGNLSKVGLLEKGSEGEAQVVRKLTDAASLLKNRVHPISVLLALKVYGLGHGVKGKGEWSVNEEVKAALDSAFYASFKSLPRSNKRLLFALDVSGSMQGSAWYGRNYHGRYDAYFQHDIPGIPTLSPAEAAAALALACTYNEEDFYIMGFAETFRDLKFRKDMRIEEAIKVMEVNTFGATDCALPSTYAQKHGLPVDAFIILTDNETNASRIHPSQALRSYRESSGLNAKQIVMGLTATSFTIADPKDVNSLDIAGFDASAPSIITEFVK